MNFNFLKTKHCYFFVFVANATNNKNKYIKGDRLIEVIDYFWVKPNIKEVIDFAKKKLTEQINTKEFVIIKFYKIKE